MKFTLPRTDNASACRRLSSTVAVIVVLFLPTVDASVRDLSDDAGAAGLVSRKLLATKSVSSFTQDAINAVDVASQSRINSDSNVKAFLSPFDGVMCYTGDGSSVTNACNTCCTGLEACQFSSATVCEGSCKGEKACKKLANDSVIFPESCTDRRSCIKSSAAFIFPSSCTKEKSCESNSGIILGDACTGQSACEKNTNFVAGNACTGRFACKENEGLISAFSCTRRDSCNLNTGLISNNSCFRVRSCQRNSGDIGFSSCTEAESCMDNSGNIGVGKCDGNQSCAQNSVDMA